MAHWLVIAIKTENSIVIGSNNKYGSMDCRLKAVTIWCLNNISTKVVSIVVSNEMYSDSLARPIASESCFAIQLPWDN